MKFFYLSIALLFIGLGAMAQKTNFKRYADKSGRIEYTWSGQISGTEILEWDNWGQKERRVSKTSMKVFGMTQTTNETHLLIGDMVYSWKADQKEGSKMKNPFMTEASKEIDDWDKFGKEMMKSMGFSKNGTEMIDGKQCDIWEGALNSKMWVYKSYALKTSTKMVGINATQKVKKYEAGKAVSASVFKVPSNIVFKDANSQFEENENDDEDSKKAKEMMKNLFEGM